jgi:formate dehydrogenase (NADP+) beta subunit
MPLGYEVTIFEQFAEPGGLMRTNIPSFRLPQGVLDEEIGAIIGMGVELKLGHKIESMRRLLEEGGFDAVFVGSRRAEGQGAEASRPAGRRRTSTSASTGSSRWPSTTSSRSARRCSSSASATPRWTAAARSLRLGAKSVKVMARKPRQFFKASAWELEDAEEENVEIVVNRSPKAFVVEGGKLRA